MEKLSSSVLLSFSFFLTSFVGIPANVINFIETHNLFSLVTSIILSVLFILVMILKLIGQYYDSCHKRFISDQDHTFDGKKKHKRKFSFFKSSNNKTIKNQ